MNDRYHDWLVQLTNLPTASGRESRVIAWIERWVAQREGLTLTRDDYGNLLIRRAGAKGPRPIYFEAHMDHPAFVVLELAGGSGGRAVLAEFRGGVDNSYFKDTPVLLYHGDAPAQRGHVEDFITDEDTLARIRPIGNKVVRIVFDQPVEAQVGDVLTWDTGPSRIEGDRLRAPACDDLAGVASLLAAYDAWLAELDPAEPNPTSHGLMSDVRLLLTRAEEMGFIGAIAACKAGTIESDARMICLENSRSFAESPIGAGPIVRVGDRTSTFDPELTYAVATVAQNLAQQDPDFVWQRKLMPGGTCEASAFQTFGYTATCLCLPLGNYHNMNEQTRRIDSETISLSDFDGLVRLLVACVTRLDDPLTAPTLRTRLDDLFEQRQRVLSL